MTHLMIGNCPITSGFSFLSRKSNITYEEFPFYISHWINELWLQPLGHHSTDLLGASVLIFFSISRLHYIPFSQVFAVFDVSARGNLLRYGGKLSTRTSHTRPNKTRKEIIWLTQSVFCFFFFYIFFCTTRVLVASEYFRGARTAGKEWSTSPSQLRS